MSNLKKKYLPLTKSQRSRGIVFSSQIIKKDGSEMKVHELNEWNEKEIAFLKTDSFFAEVGKYNLIRK